MYRKMLNAELKEVGPEGKFLLVRFVILFGLLPSRAITELELRKLTGLSRHLFRQAWNQLKQRNYLKRRARAVEVGEVTGRHYVYELGERAFETLRAYESLPSTWMNLVRALMSGLLVPRQTELRPGVRLLLSILYSRADDFGVVRGVGESVLRRLTGLNENRLKISLQKLKELEYLRAVVPGISGGTLFGKAPGAYFLNMGHASLKNHARPVSIFVNTLPIGCVRAKIDRLDGSYAERLYGVVHWSLRRKRELRSPPPSFHGIQPVVEVDGPEVWPLLELRRKEVRDYQQYKLEGYASLLLTDHWEQLSKGTVPDSSELREVVVSQFSAGGRRESGSLVEEWGQKEKAVDALLQVACRMAQDISRGMKCFPDVPFSQMRHCILPRTTARGTLSSIAVMSMPKDAQRACGKCYVLTERANWKGAPQREKEFEEERLLDLKERYWYGLLSDPMAGPKRYRSVPGT